MSNKPHFSPTDTYVLDDTVVQRTDKLRLTGIMREMDIFAFESLLRGEDDPDAGREDAEYNPLMD